LAKVQKRGYLLKILIPVITIGEGVFCVFRNPQCFGLRLGIVEAMGHLCGDEGVAVTMDEEHGVGAMLDGFEG